MFRRLILVLLVIFLFPSKSFAVWVWTPETNQWINPKWAVRDTPAEQLSFALEFFNGQEYKEAIRELQKLLKHYPKAREAAEAQFYIGKCYEGLGDLYKAYQEYQLVIDKYPYSNLSADVIKKQFELAERMIEGEGQRNEFIGAIVGGSDKVVEVLESVIRNAPYNELAPKAQYKIGLYLLEHSLYQESRDAFQKVINDYPESELAKAAEYQIALADSHRSAGAAYDQEVTQIAVDGFKEFVAKNPDAELSAKAKEKIFELREKEAENNFIIAKFYEKQKNFKAAKLYYQIIVDDFRDTSWSKKALEKIREVSTKEK